MYDLNSTVSVSYFYFFYFFVIYLKTQSVRQRMNNVGSPALVTSQSKRRMRTYKSGKKIDDSYEIKTEKRLDRD